MDWLIFKLAEDASGRGELEDSVAVFLDPPFDALVAEAKRALRGAPGVNVSATEAGVRLEGKPSLANVEAVAVALETKLGPVGICQVSTNEWWDLQDFRITRKPAG